MKHSHLPLFLFTSMMALSSSSLLAAEEPVAPQPTDASPKAETQTVETSTEKETTNTDAEVTDNTNFVVMPRVDVISTKEDMPKTASTVNIIDKKTLDESHVLTVNEALRKAPGINVRDEEGLGLRPNIGIRGLNPTRSTKITLLEDGIPLSYAPYGDNASYYHPPIDRYDHIEILKGSGQILFGPQTIGGVINYVTPSIPQKTTGMVSMSGGARTGGDHNYANSSVYVASQGARVDYTRKQGDGARDNMYSQLDDFSAKTVLEVGESQALTLRANSYTEDSMMTYSGLTEAEYRKQGRDYNPFDNDQFTGRRYGVSATHEMDFNDNTMLLTNIYASQFSRDWWRQSSTTTDTQCGGGFTATRMAGTVVNPDTCNSVQGRLREYKTAGVEPRFKITHNTFGINNELETGVKLHFEEQDRKQINGTSPDARNGTLAENSDRKTTAYSSFLLNRFLIGDWSIEPGARYEYIKSYRDNDLIANGDGSDTLGKMIPALGVAWNPTDTFTAFAGVHRGFAPPRTEDLIGGTGTSTEVNAEESTNWEMGVRSTPTDNSQLQASIFRNDFSNLIAVGSIAGGSTPLAEGEALFQGVEFSGEHNFDSGIYLRGAYTWLDKADQTSAFRAVATGAVVGGSSEGNRQPYAPEHNITTTIGFKHGKWDMQLERVYVDEQYSDFANTKTAAFNGNGQNGEIDAYDILNTAVNYKVHKKTNLFLAVKNLEDKTYIVDRTRGIQVGSPRLIEAGFQYGF